MWVTDKNTSQGPLQVGIITSKETNQGFPECVAKGSRLTWESEGRAVFAGRCFCVRNRSQPSATVRKCSNPAPMALPLGRAPKSDFSWTCRVSVCAAIPL